MSDWVVLDSDGAEVLSSPPALATPSRLSKSTSCQSFLCEVGTQTDPDAGKDDYRITEMNKIITKLVQENSRLKEELCVRDPSKFPSKNVCPPSYHEKLDNLQQREALWRSAAENRVCVKKSTAFV
jgi:hypothetical protein